MKNWIFYRKQKHMFCSSFHLDSVDEGNNKISTHHFVVRVDDWRSRRSAGKHSEKSGDGYVAYHLHDEAHLSSFPKKITNTICNTRERSMFSKTIAGKFHANSITINRTVSKSNFPSGSHTAISYGSFSSEYSWNIRTKIKIPPCLLETRVVEQIEISLTDLSNFFGISAKREAIKLKIPPNDSKNLFRMTETRSSPSKNLE